MASHASPLRYRYQAEPRQRAASLALALALVALLILLLIRMGVLPLIPTRPIASTSTFDVAPDRPTPSKQRTAARQQAAHKASPPPPASAKPPPAPEKAVMPSNFIQLDGATFAQTDLRKVPRHPEDAQASETADAGTGAGDSKAPYGPGEGPGRQRLYAAAWYTEPPAAVLAPYLRKDVDLPPGSWGEIACRTIDRFHVDDCRELGESPVGIGLSRAMRRASDLFLVRPPRVGGKSLVGAWVRIHYDIVDRK